MAEASRGRSVAYKSALACGIPACFVLGLFLCFRFFYQPYENWVFRNALQGAPGLSFVGFLKSKGSRDPNVVPGDNYNFGSIFIPKLGISESLRQGVDADTLRSAAGHPVFTAMPGESGNFVVIASRNAHWKKLESIHDGDLVTVRSKAGESLTYRIAATALLPLSDISVLSPGGGALIKTAGSETGPPKILTVTTTDAFSISSHSRSRFVAEGLLVEAPVSPPPVSEARPDEPPAVHPLSRRRRSTAVRQSQAPSNTSTEPIAAPKRHRFWHKVLHPFGN